MMITSRTIRWVLALFVTGIAGWPARGVLAQDEPISDAARASAASEAPPARQRTVVVLLRDGRIVSGQLTEEDGNYVITQPVGVMRFPAKRVEKAFSSIREVYEFKIEQLPENDFDERIKLARWCLEQKMEPEAREQLGEILRQSPKNPQARAMLVSLNQAEARMASHQRDPEVRQTSVEQEDLAAGDRPNALDTAVIYGAHRGMGISDLPVIFDLPTAQAVKRADEFTRFVHPVLQSYCARCHNESYQGEFQLVQFKTKLNRTRDALRANLDATLKLVDRENPTRSDLLSSSLRPHGRGPNQRPIFQGSNDRAYQILAAWVNKLQTSKVSEGVIPARAQAVLPGSEPGESFASQRGRLNQDTAQQDAAPRPFVTGPVITKHLPNARVVPGQGIVAEGVVNPNEFPLPLAVGGARPGMVSRPVPKARPETKVARPETKVARPVSSAATHSTTPTRDGSAAATTEMKKTGAAHPTATARSKVAVPPSKPALEDDPDDTDEAKKKARQPLKLDPALLQRTLQLRNQNR